MFIAPIIILTLLLTKIISFINFEYILKILNICRIQINNILNNLDPSLFQNVFIGILMIRIFIGGVLFQEGKTENKKTSFLKMVVFHQILNIKLNSIITIGGIFILAFSKDIIINNTHSIGIITKLFITIIIIVIVVILLKSITKIGKFIRGDTYQEEINFLKGLNIRNSEKIRKARFYFWQEKAEINEREFTEIFISHIDKAIKSYDFELAMNLGKAYEDNIEKRDYREIGYLLRPKILEWSETFRKTFYFDNKKVKSLYRNHTYFLESFFPKVIKTLITDMDGYELLDSLNKHIKEFEIKIGEQTTNKTKKRYISYLKSIFHFFCPSFFDNAKSITIREEYINSERLITTNNLEKSVIPKILLDNYLARFEEKQKTSNNKELNIQLNHVSYHLFLNTDPIIFATLLMINYHQNDIEILITNNLNFGRGGRMFISINTTREEIDTERKEKQQEEKEESYKLFIQYIKPQNFNLEQFEQIKQTIDEFETKEELIIYRKKQLSEIIDELIQRIKENEKK